MNNTTTVTMTRAAWRLAAQSCGAEASDMGRPGSSWQYTSLRQDYLAAERVARAALETGSGDAGELISYEVPDGVLSTFEDDHLLKAAETLQRRNEA
jgi:hypothetical protein